MNTKYILGFSKVIFLLFDKKIGIKVVTRKEATRVAEYAFEHAFLTGRKKVTCVHKANIMKLTDGQFLESTREVAKKYPNI